MAQLQPHYPFIEKTAGARVFIAWDLENVRCPWRDFSVVNNTLSALKRAFSLSGSRKIDEIVVVHKQRTYEICQVLPILEKDPAVSCISVHNTMKADWVADDILRGKIDQYLDRLEDYSCPGVLVVLSGDSGFDVQIRRAQAKRCHVEIMYTHELLTAGGKQYRAPWRAVQPVSGEAAFTPKRKGFEPDLLAKLEEQLKRLDVFRFCAGEGDRERVTDGTLRPRDNSAERSDAKAESCSKPASPANAVPHLPPAASRQDPARGAEACARATTDAASDADVIGQVREHEGAPFGDTDAAKFWVAADTPRRGTGCPHGQRRRPRAGVTQRGARNATAAAASSDHTAEEPRHSKRAVPPQGVAHATCGNDSSPAWPPSAGRRRAPHPTEPAAVPRSALHSAGQSGAEPSDANAVSPQPGTLPPGEARPASQPLWGLCGRSEEPRTPVAFTGWGHSVAAVAGHALSDGEITPTPPPAKHRFIGPARSSLLRGTPRTASMTDLQEAAAEASVPMPEPDATAYQARTPDKQGGASGRAAARSRVATQSCTPVCAPGDDSKVTVDLASREPCTLNANKGGLFQADFEGTAQQQGLSTPKAFIGRREPVAAVAWQVCSDGEITPTPPPAKHRFVGSACSSLLHGPPRVASTTGLHASVTDAPPPVLPRFEAAQQPSAKSAQAAPEHAVPVAAAQPEAASAGRAPAASRETKHLPACSNKANPAPSGRCAASRGAADAVSARARHHSSSWNLCDNFASEKSPSKPVSPPGACASPATPCAKTSARDLQCEVSAPPAAARRSPPLQSAPCAAAAPACKGCTLTEAGSLAGNAPEAAALDAARPPQPSASSNTFEGEGAQSDAGRHSALPADMAAAGSSGLSAAARTDGRAGPAGVSNDLVTDTCAPSAAAGSTLALRHQASLKAMEETTALLRRGAACADDPERWRALIKECTDVVSAPACGASERSAAAGTAARPCSEPEHCVLVAVVEPKEAAVAAAGSAADVKSTPDVQPEVQAPAGLAEAEPAAPAAAQVLAAVQQQSAGSAARSHEDESAAGRTLSESAAEGMLGALLGSRPNKGKGGVAAQATKAARKQQRKRKARQHQARQYESAGGEQAQAVHRQAQSEAQGAALGVTGAKLPAKESVKASATGPAKEPAVKGPAMEAAKELVNQLAEEALKEPVKQAMQELAKEPAKQAARAAAAAPNADARRKKQAKQRAAKAVKGGMRGGQIAQLANGAPSGHTAARAAQRYQPYTAGLSATGHGGAHQPPAVARGGRTLREGHGPCAAQPAAHAAYPVVQPAQDAYYKGFMSGAGCAWQPAAGQGGCGGPYSAAWPHWGLHGPPAGHHHVPQYCRPGLRYPVVAAQASGYGVGAGMGGFPGDQPPRGGPAWKYGRMGQNKGAYGHNGIKRTRDAEQCW